MNRPRPNRPLRNTTVVETAQLTPHMVRIIVEGPELDGSSLGSSPTITSSADSARALAHTPSATGIPACYG
jgi:NADPH-dependent ferric siderophore reductase